MRYLVAGDLHGNKRWLTSAVMPAAQTCGATAIIAVGDFGYWPVGMPTADPYLVAAASGPVPVWFLDGNHENYARLRHIADVARRRHSIEDLTAPIPLFGGLTYLPRGCRLRVGTTTVAVLGGARSIDRQLRQIGKGWWYDEEVTDDDLARLGTGHADVLLSHDAPSGYAIPGLVPDDELPAAWRSERPACEQHRRQLRRAMEAVKPGLVIHGHYHRRYEANLAEAWGPVHVLGLDCDGIAGNTVILDLADHAPPLVTAFDAI